MKEQSAVDFLHSKILFNIGLDDNDIFKLRELVKIAKKLEDKQHGKTWDAALDAGQNRAWNVMRAYSDFDDWYQETFVSKGSGDTLKDYHIVETNEMVDQVPDVRKMVEDDVEKLAKDFADNSSKCDYEDGINVGKYQGFITGYNKAKEMQKQEIIDAYLIGQSLGFDDSPRYMAEKYYKEEFNKD